jgi:hypothetical protein
METLKAVYIVLALAGAGATFAGFFGSRSAARGAAHPVRPMAKALASLRGAEFFALGAGITGLVATAQGLGAATGALWSAAGGAVVLGAFLLVSRLGVKEQDSSFRPEDLILEEAVVTVPLAPGMMGKAELRKSGMVVEIQVKAVDGDQAFARGSRVRVIDYRNECYLVEPSDEEHLVH